MRQKQVRDAYAASRCRYDRKDHVMLRRMATRLRDDGIIQRGAVRGSVAERDPVRIGNEEYHRHRRSHDGNGRTVLVVAH